MQKRLATWKHKHVYFDLLAYLLYKLLKNWKILMLDGKLIMKKWRFWRQETKGRPDVLDKAAKIVVKKTLCLVCQVTPSWSPIL